MNYMFVDLEIIAANDGEKFEKFIEKIEYRASKKCLEKLSDLYFSGLINEDEYRVNLEESYDFKDRVLEEVDDQYKNRINYEEVYEINASNQGIVDYIRKISSTIDTYVIFYYNTERELSQKKLVCQKYFPNCKVLGIKFYKDDYNKDYRRRRTNKAEYIKSMLGLQSLENCLLIDKSIKSCDEWNNLSGDATLYRTHAIEKGSNGGNVNVLKITK